MSCCAVGPCDNPTCYLCTVIAKLPQPVTGLDLQKKDRAHLRESEAVPDLSAPRAAAIALGQRKRHRVMDKRRFGAR